MIAVSLLASARIYPDALFVREETLNARGSTNKETL